MRPIVIAAATAGAAATAWTLPALTPLVASLCGPLGIQRTLADPGATVALTFDDGPHPVGTPATLELLAAADARATFFLVGEQVRRWPQVAAQIAAAGHAIGLHGDRHRNLLRITPRALAADLDRGHAEIVAATGATVERYRPPYGIFSPAGLVLARQRGWTPTLWSRWGRDWRKHIRPERITRLVSDGVVAGDVLLLHDADHYSARDSWRRMVTALPHVLGRIEHAGLRSVAM